jgi:alkanesulfonate monooxygenase SsuD/methylene tetrahydromethanopterin reductase-like flavin-dependent oxidoreductase (luciferase family)
MRLGIVVDRSELSAMAAEVEAAAANGLDFVYVAERDGEGNTRNAPTVACALRPFVGGLGVVIEVTAGSNPIALAEEIAVADQILRGRVAVALGGDDSALVAETLAVLEPALRSRPFRHRGARWTLPREDGTVLVTPPPAQLELPIWLAGSVAITDDPLVARDRALEICAVRISASAPADRLDRIRELGRLVRPQLQGNAIPEDLLTEWKTEYRNI